MARRFGTHPDIPDVRDRIYLPPVRTRLPARVDLRPQCPPVYNQHSLNSCSAHAIAAAIWFDLRRSVSAAAPSPSRLFIYYNERVTERVVHENVPVSLRDGYRSVARTGVCAETLWPYRVRQYARKPHARCYQDAKRERVLSYFRLHRSLDSMRACLAEGFPFTLGVSVHASFVSPAVRRTGRVPMPKPHELLRGGHAMLAVGYNDRDEHLIVRNSWGRGWGLDGYCLIPYEFILHPSLSWDFWTSRRIGQ